MLTVFLAAAVLAACAAARWFLDRAERKETEYLNGSVRLKTLWNQGAAFGLPVGREMLLAVSVALLGVVWTNRREHPVGAGLALGGGLSNLLERLRAGKVYDYVQFPKAPGKLKRYVYNLADFCIFAGAIALMFPKKKR